MRSTLAGLLLTTFALTARAQATLKGTVTAPNGTPAVGANVFIIETLDGALSDSTGHWSFSTAHTGPAILVVKMTGFAEVRRAIELPALAPIAITLSKNTHTLAPTTVVASRYSASDERGSTLTTLDVVATPGTNADVMRAIQTLPGVQSVDEGTGLYVRGGDYIETHVLVNDAVLTTAFNLESPNGTFIGTVDPFLLDGIYFSSGGFGAKYGNVLSGIAALNTLGLPKRSSATATAGLAALSASAASRVNKQLGVRVATNQFDTDVMFRVNGSTVQYATPPRGYDRSASAIWSYRPTGEVKVFGISQTTNLASTLEDPSYVGTYSLDVGSHLGVLNWRDVFGRWSPSIRVSDTKLGRTQEYGAFTLNTGQRYSGGSAQLDWISTGGLTLRGGTEWERSWSFLRGSIPDNGYDKGPGARITTVDGHPDDDRVAVFGEMDALVGNRTRFVAGLRRDHSALTDAATLDPRLSAAVTLVKGVTLTAAWGVYHQIPDPLFLDGALGDPSLPSMRATHTIVGIQAGSVGRMLRVELFDKRYRDLAQATRDYDVAGGGTGSARGADVFASGTLFKTTRWRFSYSAVSARRTDPNTGTMARAPFDVSSSITTVVNRPLWLGWQLGLTHRYATGRPFTPVVSASFDATRSVWVPTYGTPMSERIPSFRRLDLGLTRLMSIAGSQAVFFTAVNNLLDRDNLYAYRYPSDYSARIPIRSIFKRSFYVGASITTQ